MAQTPMLKARGLFTFPNQLSEVPQGALAVADNVIVSRNSVIEPRRGLKQFGTEFTDPNDRAKQLIEYKGRILRHFDNQLDFDSDGAGTFSVFSGTYEEVETNLRIKSVEANGNLYFTTSEGIKKISATSPSDFTTASGYIRESGAPQALDVDTSVDYSTAGFFSPESKVAYRVIWGYTDANNNLILSTASQRAVVTNFSTTDSGTVDLEFSIPNDITTEDFFYQVYRTSVFEKGALPSLDDVDPGDEMNLVIEDFPTPSELSSRIVTVNDLTPEDFRNNGTPLYSNPVSGEGILQSNDQPPVAKDVALFKNTLFYANTKTKHQLELDFLSVSQLVSGSSQITITDGSTVNTYTFVGEAEVTDFTFDTQANTTDGGYFLLNSASNERGYFVWFDKTGSTAVPNAADTVGRLGIKVDISGSTTANDVATEAATAINSEIDFSVPAPGGATITVTNVKNGNTTDAVDGLTGVGGIFNINVTTQGDGEDFGNLDVLLSSASTPSQQLDETARSLISVINRNANEIVEAFYLSGQEDVPGQVLLKTKDLGTGEFYIVADNSSTASQFNPVPGVEDTGTAAIGAGTVTVTAASHGLSNGTQIVLYNSTTTPSIDGVYTISNTTTNTFDVSATVTVSGSVDFSTTTVNSDNQVEPNTLYFSKFQEPEAVPIVNNIPVGPKDKEILRIIPLRESMFILKEDGIYRLTGENGAFNVDLFDSSAIPVAPDTADVVNNQVYVLSNQGVITISDTGVSIISRPIESKILNLVSDNFDYELTSFGVNYEVDNAYLLWMVEEETDTVATQCFRYDNFTNNWTRFPISKTCGIVSSEDNRLYTGAADEPFIEQERKNFSRTDYADRDFALSFPANAIGDLQVELSSSSEAAKGDSLVQEQYLTISQFNRLLKKLDLDQQVADSDYFATLEVSPGDSLRAPVDNLAAKLDADSGVSDTNYAASLTGTNTFPVIQADHNIIVNKLNADTGVKFTNYKESTETTNVEVIITSTVKNSNLVNVRFNAPFIQGPVTLFKGINAEVVWTPYIFGDPSIMKQVRESTIMFENTVFTSATVSFSSDLSPDFEEIPFDRSGNGDWGLFIWNNQNWGGGGSAVPLRTYIPRDKQRSRFINKKFEHNGARERFAIFGISYTFRPISERAYRE